MGPNIKVSSIAIPTLLVDFVTKNGAIMTKYIIAFLSSNKITANGTVLIPAWAF